MEENKSYSCLIRVSIADMMELRVRRSIASVLPESLFQSIPADAMTIFATLPYQDIQVSIPHSLYPIGKNPAEARDGYLLIYPLQPNRRYEATKVIYKNRKFEIAEFRSFAEQWAESRTGKILSSSKNYIHASPTVEQWGVILRDSGYVVAVPSNRSQEQLSCGFSIRIPVLVGSKRPLTPVPGFSRAELNLDGSRWVSFEEYQNLRALQSQPPPGIVDDLRNWSHRLAAESGISSWDFPAGMLFADRAEWWGNQDRRRTEHEGIDFAPIPEGTPIRAIADGEIVLTLDDFLNKTVLVRHPAIRNDEKAIFYSLYSHIQPFENLSGPVSKGRILGRIGESKSGTVPIHLHLTAAWIPESLRPEELTMNHIHPGFAPIVLINLNSCFLR
jgi:hypothetical protein